MFQNCYSNSTLLFRRNALIFCYFLIFVIVAINTEVTDEDLKPALGKNMETEEIQKPLNGIYHESPPNLNMDHFKMMSELVQDTASLYVIHTWVLLSPSFPVHLLCLTNICIPRNWFMFQFLFPYFLSTGSGQTGFGASLNIKLLVEGKFGWREETPSEQCQRVLPKWGQHISAGRPCVLVARGWQGSATFQIQQLRGKAFTQLAQVCSVRMDLTARERQGHEAVIDFTHKEPGGKLQMDRRSWVLMPETLNGHGLEAACGL